MTQPLYSHSAHEPTRVSRPGKPDDRRPQRESLRVEVVTSETAFRALKPLWTGLSERAAPHDVFLTHEWFDAAWQWCGLDAQLRVLAVYRNEVLVGACPLVLRHIRVRRIPMRRLEFLTVPDTQSCDFLIAPGEGEAVTAAVAAWLRQHASEWDTLQLNYLPEHSSAAQLIVHLTEAGMRSQITPSSQNPYIDLQGGWEAFYGSRSRRLKKNNNLIANRLSRVGTLELDWIQADAPETQLRAALAEVEGLSASSWKQQTGNSLDFLGPRRFIERLTALATERGWLSIWLLRLNQKPVAMEYQIIYNGHVHALRADFDESCGHDLSPGSYLNWQLLQRLFGEQLARYHMGPGNNAYKYRWTEDAAPLRQLTAYSPGWRGKGWSLIDLFVVPLARRMLHRSAK